MGSNLSVVNLGSDFSVNDMHLGKRYSCALNPEGAVKCWGYGEWGQLGVTDGSTDNIGDDVNEMGDNLDQIDLGTSFNVSTMGTGFSARTSCAISTELELKCWGMISIICLCDCLNLSL